MDLKRIKHGGDLEKVAYKFGLSPENIVDFSANINFLGSPSSLRETIINSLNKMESYPEIDAAGVSKAISNYYGIDSSEILCGNGASELIYALVQALKSGRILIPCPTFSEYEGGVRGAGLEPDYLYLKEAEFFYPSPDLIIPSLPQEGLLFLCNPNNPTGGLVQKKDLLTILKEAEKLKTVVMIDESFMDFVEEEEKYSFLRDKDMPENLIILRSLTKFFALPGLRLGFLRATQNVKEKILLSLPPWNVNALAQEGGKVIFTYNKYIKDCRKVINKEKEYFYNEIKKIQGLLPYPPGANYLFIKVQKGPNSKELQEIAGKRGAYIRDCASFRGLDKSFIRVAVRKREDNVFLIKILKDIFES